MTSTHDVIEMLLDEIRAHEPLGLGLIDRDDDNLYRERFISDDPLVRRLLERARPVGSLWHRLAGKVAALGMSSRARGDIYLLGFFTAPSLGPDNHYLLGFTAALPARQVRAVVTALADRVQRDDRLTGPAELAVQGVCDMAPEPGDLLEGLAPLARRPNVQLDGAGDARTRERWCPGLSGVVVDVVRILLGERRVRLHDLRRRGGRPSP